MQKQEKKEKSSETSEKYVRTDLACEEAGKGGTAAGKAETDGSDYTEYTRGEVLVSRLRVRKECGYGTYVTVSCGAIQHLTPEESEELISTISAELRRMSETLTGKKITKGFSVLVTGLGNAEMTADAIGPETVKRLPVTRHLYSSGDPLLESIGEDYCAISALTPGVLAQTGIETAELIRGAAKNVSPDLLLAVDALAARSCSRLASTVQLSDTGLRPGSGIGNCRNSIDREGMGVPVIAIGVPTVVSSSTLVFDALSRAGIAEEEIEPSLLEVLENGGDFFVSPKEIDSVTRSVAEVLSSAIADAFAVS